MRHTHAVMIGDNRHGVQLFMISSQKPLRPSSGSTQGTGLLELPDHPISILNSSSISSILLPFSQPKQASNFDISKFHPPPSTLDLCRIVSVNTLCMVETRKTTSRVHHLHPLPGKRVRDLESWTPFVETEALGSGSGTGSGSGSPPSSSAWSC